MSLPASSSLRFGASSRVCQCVSYKATETLNKYTMNINISTMNAALKFGTIPVLLVRSGNGYCWRLPKVKTKDGGIDHAAGMSHVELCGWGKQTKMDARLSLSSRFLAQVYKDSEVAFINPRHVMKMPNWHGPYGGLVELAYAMKRAGLIN